MFFFQANNISGNTTTISFSDLGVKTLKEVDSIPMYNVRYKGEHLSRTSMKVCGEFNGDCYQFVSKYLDIFWE